MQLDLQMVLHDMLILTKPDCCRIIAPYKGGSERQGGEILPRDKTQNNRSDCSFSLVGEIAKSAGLC